MDEIVFCLCAFFTNLRAKFIVHRVDLDSKGPAEHVQRSLLTLFDQTEMENQKKEVRNEKVRELSKNYFLDLCPIQFNPNARAALLRSPRVTIRQFRAYFIAPYVSKTFSIRKIPTRERVQSLNSMYFIQWQHENYFTAHCSLQSV